MPEQWTCHECGDTFQRREHHQRHLRVHTKEKPFACSLCNSSFGRVDSLARHYSSTHMQAAPGTSSSDSTERQRVSRACKRCSASKVRCDGKHPCEKCAAADAVCVYEPPKRRRTGIQSLSAEPSSKRRPNETHAHQESNDISESQLQTQHHSMPQNDTMATLEPSPPGHQPSVITASVNALDLMQFDFFTASDISTFPNDLNNASWLSDSSDMAIWPNAFDLQTEAQLLQDISSFVTDPLQFGQEQQIVPAPYLPPTPASDMAELYSRSHTPVLDKDAVDIRQYNPTSIRVDAPLSLPVIDASSIAEADLEDFAHVPGLSHEQIEAVDGLIDDVQTKPHYPLFDNAKLPPESVINAWIQLYFEYFHPVFPILHKATFNLPDTPPLLILIVAAIGAQFSSIPNSLVYAASLQELVRRCSSRQCEYQNQNGRTVWMTQVVLLNSLAMSHSGEKRALEISEILQCVPVALARRKSIFEDVVTHERISQMQVPLQQIWQLWIMDEGRRRTGFGVWLVDCAFRCDFNLTTVLDSRELRNSLPQADERWDANSAQSWASYPPGLGSGRTRSLAETVATDDWMCVWAKTGTLGKQVLLQELMDRVRPKDPKGHSPLTSPTDTAHAKDLLKRLLATLEHADDTPVADLKALITHRAMCLAALTICCSPTMDLTKAALCHVYNRMTDQDLSQIARVWREAPHQGREAVSHAASLFETIRNNHTTHWSMPAYLLNAALLLWSFSLLFDNSEITGFVAKQEESGSVSLGTTGIHSDQVHEWIIHGHGRVKLPSIANLLSWQGRRKLLEHSTTTMAGLRSWGVSKGYQKLLKRLQASEAASRPA